MVITRGVVLVELPLVVMIVLDQGNAQRIGVSALGGDGYRGQSAVKGI